MASGTVGSTSTYVEGKTFSFAKSVASKVLDAAKAAKNVKHQHDAMERKGITVPESEKKGLFVKALKEQFVSNPIKNIKKSLGKKVEKGASVVGLFGKKGRATERKILALSKKKLGVRRSRGSFPMTGGRGGGGGGSSSASSDSPLTPIVGSLALDIEIISNSLQSLTSLFNVTLDQTNKISGSLGEIKNILTEQLSIQRGQLEDDQIRAKEASLENSQQNSGTAASTSTIRDNGLMDLFSLFGNLKNLLNVLKSLPGMFGGLIKGLLSKIPGGKTLLKGLSSAKGFFSGAAQGAKGFMKGGMMKFLRPIFKRIPIFGGLLDFIVSLALGEPVGRAAAKAVGATVGAGLGTLVPVPGLASIAGGFIGDWLGGTAYDLIVGNQNKSQEKLAEGGVMLGEAGTEMVTPLSSSVGKQLTESKSMQEAYNMPYNAVAGGMLAITKDFVEGLGPIGQSVAPVIKDDVDKLGRVFDIPAVNTQLDIGGAGLTKNPNAEKEGKKYMEDLVKGSLEKIAPKKETKPQSSSGGGGGGGGGGSTTPSSDTPGSGSPTDAGGSQQPQMSSGEQTLQSLKENTKFVNKEKKGFFGQNEVISAVSGTDKAGVRRVKMVDENGNLSDKYYYNANGDIFSIDPTLGTKGISQLSPDMIKSGLGSRGKFYRNLQTGQVVVTNKPPVGYYNYEKHGIVQESLAQAKSNAVNMELRTVKTKPISSLTDVERQNFGTNPYGPVADISKIKAEKGIVVSSRRGMRTHPVTGKRKMHQGTDISAPQGTKLFAFSDGKVEDVKREGAGDAGYGNSVYWVDDRGWGHLYAHLHQFGKGVTPGAEFKKGKLLGSVGSTGVSTGPHLHWEMAQNPADVGRSGRSLIDPLSKYDYMSPFRGSPGPGDGLTGNVPGDTTSGEYSDREETPEDPFEAMDKAIEGMIAGLGLSTQIARGEIKTVEDYKSAEEKMRQMVSSAMSARSSAPTGTAAQKASDPATNPEHFKRAGEGGAAPATGSKPQSGVKPASAPAAKATEVTPEKSKPQASMLVAPASASTSTQPIPQAQDLTAYGMSGFSYPSLASSAVKFNPSSFQFAHLS